MAKSNRRAARIGLIVLEVAGAVLAVAAAGAVFVWWRLQGAPISLAAFEPGVEFAVEKSLPQGHAVEISGLTLDRAGGDGRYAVTAHGVAVAGPHGRPVASLDGISIVFSLREILTGEIGPSEIFADRAGLNIVRRADRQIELGASRQGGARESAMPSAFRNNLRTLRIDNADIAFFDEASGRQWKSKSASALVTSDGAGRNIAIKGEFDIGGEAAALDLRIDGVEDGARARLALSNAPVGDLLETFFGANAAIIHAPVDGVAMLELDGKGAVIASQIEGRAGAGRLAIDGRTLDVNGIELAAAFNPADNAFAIERLRVESDVGSLALAGSATLAQGKGGRFEAVEFNLTDGAVSIADDQLFDEPLDVTDLRVAGVYNDKSRRLDVSAFNASVVETSVSGSGAVIRGPKAGDAASPQVALSMTVEDALDPARILRAWPVNIGLGARDFVRDRLSQASIENVVLNVDLPRGAVRPNEPTPDEAISLTFDIADARVIYAPGMRPLTGAQGKARLTGNRFVIEDINGRVDNVRVSNGDVEFTALAPRGEPVHIRFDAAGDAAELLTILNDEPLSVLKSTDFTPERFAGNVTVRAHIMRPNRREVPRERYEFDGKATFEDLMLTEFVSGADLAGARGELNLDTRAMTIAANAALGGAPIDLEWRKRFGARSGASTLTLSGVMDSTTGDIFGFPTRQFLRGQFDFKAVAKGEPSRLESVEIDADLADAALIFEPFGWRKPVGAPAQGALAFSFDEAGSTIERFSINGPGLAIEAKGSLAPGGAIETAEISRFWLEGGADFSATAVRAQSRQLDVSVTGKFLNLGPLVQSIVETEASADREIDWGDGILVRGRIDEIAFREDASYTDASLDVRRSPERLEMLDLSARSASGAPLAVTMSGAPPSTAGGPVINARTDDIGSLMRAIFGITSIEGGEGSMRLALPPAGDGQSGVDGVLEARRLRVVEAPLLARIFAAGSFEGLSNLLNGEGIDLARAYASFGFHDGVLTLEEARASGPSVGITSSGRIVQGAEGQVSLEGAVAPAYQLNSLLGKAPIVGELFVNRKGEGVVALSYDVTGLTAAPVVSVNPLSALAPGVLRRIFETPRAAPETAPEE